jgi:toxin YhaV
LRTYRSKTDAYAVFAKMLDEGNPPNTWAELVKAAGAKASMKRLKQLAAKADRKQR